VEESAQITVYQLDDDEARAHRDGRSSGPY
jgi:hypothetical protein